MLRLPQIDEDYNKKIEQSLEIIEKVNQAVEKVEASIKPETLIKVGVIEEGEEVYKELAAVYTKVKIMFKEIYYYKGFSFFANLLAKPIYVSRTLLQRLHGSQARLKNALSQARGLVIQIYNSNNDKARAIESQFNTFVEQKLVLKNGCIAFEAYEENEKQMENYKEELLKIQSVIKQYAVDKYPQSIALIPKPEDRAVAIANILRKMETALKIIKTGELLNSVNLAKILENLNLNNLIEKFEAFKESLDKEIKEKELIVGSPLVSQGNLQEITKKVLLLLVSLRHLTKRVFEFHERNSRLYSNFACSYDDNPRMYETLIKQLTVDLAKSAEQLFETPFEESVKHHRAFVSVINKLKELRKAEKSLLAGLATHFKMVRENLSFYQQEIQPIAYPSNYLNMLDKWPEKHHHAKNVWDRMSPVYANLLEYRENPNLVPEIRSIVDEFTNNQQLVLNSIDVCIAFFEAGKVISEKLVEQFLSPKLRIDRAEILDFINDFEEFMGKLKLKAERGKGKVMVQFDDFLEIIMKLLYELLEFLKIIDEKYGNIPHSLDKVREMDPKDLTAIIGVAFNSLHTLEIEFTDNVDIFDTQLHNKCKIVKAIRNFVEKVISKEVRIYHKLLAEIQKMQDFIQLIQRDFIWVELAQSKYKNLKSLSLDKIQKYQSQCSNYIHHLENYLQLEEITGRAVIHDILERRLLLLLELNKIFLLFANFYEQIREYWTQIDGVLTKPVELATLAADLEQLDFKLTKIIKDVKRNYDAITNLIIVEEEISMINLKGIVLDDIGEFLQRSSKWVRNLRKKIIEYRDFDALVMENFKGRVYLLREDWIQCLKSWLPTAKEELQIETKVFQLGYEGIFERMEEFSANIKEKYIELKESTIAQIIHNVKLLNSNFFDEKFFVVDRSDPADKITPKLIRLAEKMREKRIPMQNMHRRLTKYNIALTEALESLEFLSDSERLRVAGFNGVEGMNLVKKYLYDFTLHQWQEVIKVLLEKGHSIVKATKEENVWIKAIEMNIVGPIFGKQMDMLKGFWLVHHAVKSKIDL